MDGEVYHAILQKKKKRRHSNGFQGVHSSMMWILDVRKFMPVKSSSWRKDRVVNENRVCSLTYLGKFLINLQSPTKYLEHFPLIRHILLLYFSFLRINYLNLTCLYFGSSIESFLYGNKLSKISSFVKISLYYVNVMLKSYARFCNIDSLVAISVLLENYGILIYCDLHIRSFCKLEILFYFLVFWKVTLTKLVSVRVVNTFGIFNYFDLIYIGFHCYWLHLYWLLLVCVYCMIINH